MSSDVGDAGTVSGASSRRRMDGNVTAIVAAVCAKKCVAPRGDHDDVAGERTGTRRAVDRRTAFAAQHA